MSRSEHSQHLAIRVLILGMNQFSKPQGLCRLTANLALCLADSDEISEVSVAVGAWQIAHLQDCFGLHGPKIRLIPADCGNNVQSRYMYYYFGFPALAKMIRPDVVHLPFPKPFFRKSIAAPVVTTVLDLYAWDAPSTIGYPDIYLSRFVLRTAVRNSDALVCITKFTRSRLNARFSRLQANNHQAVIYPPIRQLPTPRAEPIAQAPFLLAVAGQWRHKNLDLVIQAFDLLLREGSVSQDIQLYLVGAKGPDSDRLLSIIGGLGLTDHVHMRSAVSDEELAGLYKDCEALVVASAIEGFCLPVIEAALLYTRIICSDIPVLQEIAPSYAAFFSLSGDPVRNLANSIRTALAAPKKASSAIRDRYSPANCRNDHVELYKHLLGYRAEGSCLTGTSEASLQVI